MNEKCKVCGCEVFTTETVGHCNNHGEPNYQETAVIYRCAECGEFIKEVAYNSLSDSEEVTYNSSSDSE